MHVHKYTPPDDALWCRPTNGTSAICAQKESMADYSTAPRQANCSKAIEPSHRPFVHLGSTNAWT